MSTCYKIALRKQGSWPLQGDRAWLDSAISAWGHAGLYSRLAGRGQTEKTSHCCLLPSLEKRLPWPPLKFVQQQPFPASVVFVFMEVRTTALTHPVVAMETPRRLKNCNFLKMLLENAFSGPPSTFENVTFCLRDILESIVKSSRPK